MQNIDMELNIPSKYRQDIEDATILLKKEGSKAVFLFGSLVTGKIHEESDIDIGIKGLPRDKFINLYSKLYYDFGNKIDLVDFDENDEFYSLLNNLGEVVQIG
jgi:predicted nucleotidyltransferase